ncbi:MAG: hypothetical protein F2754_11000 [Actinobacteria bacterium]|uniref:Unannotated protein n=1 Tax=freshwater metagenome TaxID=449393 RepID=A0A6J7AQT9_9ZZZZ|nr:hypothetical protein [Actinomycetota bacterium]MSW93090.1 hypothetical protein [Actinomycetota bacterium]MSX87901.1 hypothetical protein [Actinomycetota bacterium]MSY71700.1 hypothetical protein [Actinomycetota bacterium]
MAEQTDKISREDLEAKFRDVKGGVDQRAFAAKELAKPFAIGAGVLVLLLVYFIGKRVGKTKSTIVEIRRI